MFCVSEVPPTVFGTESYRGPETDKAHGALKFILIVHHRTECMRRTMLLSTTNLGTHAQDDANKSCKLLLEISHKSQILYLNDKLEICGSHSSIDIVLKSPGI